MTDENPYEPIVADSASMTGKHRCLHRFLFLNAILVGLPAGCVITVWLVLALNGVEVSGSSGSIGWGALLIAVGYLAIPNLIMVAMRQNRS